MEAAMTQRTEFHGIQKLMEDKSPLIPWIMGVVNVTPDSFSDGGQWFTAQKALKHAQDLINQGARIIDIGGESTRPGSEPVEKDEELRRVIPVIEALNDYRSNNNVNFAISIDTTKAAVAVQAIEAGADIVNDVSGGCFDEQMLSHVAQMGCPYILQHWRGWLKKSSNPFYAGQQTNDSHSSTEHDLHVTTAKFISEDEDVVGIICKEVGNQIKNALSQGVKSSQIIVDPGLGFAKAGIKSNVGILKHISRIKELGYPVLVGISRKHFTSEIYDESLENKSCSQQCPQSASATSSQSDDVQQPTMQDKDIISATLAALVSMEGVWGVRVHDVSITVDSLKAVKSWKNI